MTCFYYLYVIFFEHSFEHGFEHGFEHELKLELQSYFDEAIH